MCYKHGWIIKGGQKHITSNHEKGSRDQNLKAEERKTVPQVGVTITPNTGKDTAGKKPAVLPEDMAAWLGQTSLEVGLSGPTTPREVSECIP